MPRSTGEERVCEVLTALSDAYEADPVYHPSARQLCARFAGRIASGQSAEELGEAEVLLWDTHNKHTRMLLNQLRDGYTPRSLDEALVYVCQEALKTLEGLRQAQVAKKRAVPVARVVG